MVFAEKVKFVRQKLLISQMELAKMIGVSFSTINRWENEKFEPSFLMKSKFEKFCQENNIKLEVNE